MTAPVDIGTLIVRTPGVVGGRPRIEGTRMPVDRIAMLWQQGQTAEDIVDRIHTFLSLAQVHAALAYYFANREDIDRSIVEEDAFAAELAAESLREGNGPPWLTDEEREARTNELERKAALLRSRLR